MAKTNQRKLAVGRLVSPEPDTFDLGPLAGEYSGDWTAVYELYRRELAKLGNIRIIVQPKRSAHENEYYASAFSQLSHIKAGLESSLVYHTSSDEPLQIVAKFIDQPLALRPPVGPSSGTGMEAAGQGQGRRDSQRPSGPLVEAFRGLIVRHVKESPEDKRQGKLEDASEAIGTAVHLATAALGLTLPTAARFAPPADAFEAVTQILMTEEEKKRAIDRLEVALELAKKSPPPDEEAFARAATIILESADHCVRITSPTTDAGKVKRGRPVKRTFPVDALQVVADPKDGLLLSLRPGGYLTLKYAQFFLTPYVRTHTKPSPEAR